MAVTDLLSTFQWPHHVTRQDTAVPAFAAGTSTISSGQYAAYIYQAREDMVITKVGFRVQAATGSPKATAAIYTVDATTGLASADWNTTSAAVNGNSALVANTYYETTLANSATISRGQYFAIRLAHGGSGTSFSASKISNLNSNLGLIPYIDNNGTISVLLQFQCIHVSGSGGPYRLQSAGPVTTITNVTDDNSPAGSEHGLRFQAPVAFQVIGARVYQGGQTGGYNIVLRDDSMTELGSTSTAIDKDILLPTSNHYPHWAYFDHAYTVTAGTWYRLGVQPDSATNIGISTLTVFTDNTYMAAIPGGINQGYYSYDGTTITDSTVVFPILDLLVDGITAATSSGGGIIG